MAVSERDAGEKGFRLVKARGLINRYYYILMRQGNQEVKACIVISLPTSPSVIGLHANRRARAKVPRITFQSSCLRSYHTTIPSENR